MHIAAYKILVEVTIPGIEKLRDTLKRQVGGVYAHGEDRPHPLHGRHAAHLGQEFSGYVSQLDHGMRAIKNTLAHLSGTGPGRHGRRYGHQHAPRLLRERSQAHCRTHRPALRHGRKQI